MGRTADSAMWRWVPAVIIMLGVAACGSNSGGGGSNSGGGGSGSASQTRAGNPVMVDGLSWQTQEVGACTNLYDVNSNPIQAQVGWVYAFIEATNNGSNPVDISNVQLSLRSGGATYNSADNALSEAGLNSLPSTLEPGADQFGFYIFDAPTSPLAGDSILITDPNGGSGRIPIAAGDLEPLNQPSQEGAATHFWCSS